MTTNTASSGTIRIRWLIYRGDGVHMRMHIIICYVLSIRTEWKWLNQQILLRKGVDAENAFRQLQSQSNRRDQNGDDGDEVGKEGGGDKDKKNATPSNQSKGAGNVLSSMDKEQAEKLKSILEKADYFNIEFQYGEKIISSTGALTIRTSNGILKIAAQPHNTQKL